MTKAKIDPVPKSKIAGYLEKCLSDPGFYTHFISFVTVVLCFVLLLAPTAFIVTAHFHDSDQSITIGYLRYCLHRTNGTTCDWIISNFQQIHPLDISKNSAEEITALLDLTAAFQNPLLIATSITSVVFSLALVVLVTIITLTPNLALIKPERIQEFHPAHRDNIPFLVLTRRGLTTAAQVIGFFAPACWCILALSTYLMVEVSKQLANVATELVINAGKNGFSIVWVLCAGSVIIQGLLYVILTCLAKKRSAAYA